jgi:hypothetical protein
MQHSENGNRSAFPASVVNDFEYNGLTKREYFIGQALSGTATSSLPCKIISKNAIDTADAVLQLLNKEAEDGKGK